MGRLDAESETLIPTIGGVFDVAHTLRGEGHDASEDGSGRGTPLVPVSYAIQAGALRTNPESGPSGIGVQADHAYTLEARKEVQCVAFSCKDHGADAGEISPTLRSMGHDGSHANGGGQVAVALALRGRDGGAAAELGDDCAFTLRAAQGGGDKPHVMTAMAVRRLTPTECERLQGFPDGWTGIRHGGKPTPDGPRYKALGNSMAIPPMRWLGRRIAMVDAIQALQEAA